MKKRHKRAILNTTLRKLKNVVIAIAVVAYNHVPLASNLKITATIFILTFLTDLWWERRCNNKLIKDFQQSKK